MVLIEMNLLQSVNVVEKKLPFVKCSDLFHIRRSIIDTSMQVLNIQVVPTEK